MESSLSCISKGKVRARPSTTDLRLSRACLWELGVECQHGGQKMRLTHLKALNYLSSYCTRDAVWHPHEYESLPLQRSRVRFLLFFLLRPGRFFLLQARCVRWALSTGRGDLLYQSRRSNTHQSRAPQASSPCVRSPLNLIGPDLRYKASISRHQNTRRRQTRRFPPVSLIAARLCFSVNCSCLVSCCYC